MNNVNTAYFPSNHFDAERECSYCRDVLSESQDQDIVAHTQPNSDEHFHHVHKKCIRIWASKNPTCPTCRGSIDFDSLAPTLKERTIAITKDAAFGIAFGGTMVLAVTSAPEIVGNLLTIGIGTAILGGKKAYDAFFESVVVPAFNELKAVGEMLEENVSLAVVGGGVTGSLVGIVIAAESGNIELATALLTGGASIGSTVAGLIERKIFGF